MSMRRKGPCRPHESDAASTLPRALSNLRIASEQTSDVKTEADSLRE
jgi:hypothetical protein